MKVDFEQAIVGAGFAGIGAAIRLQQAGRHNFIIFEKAAEVGGTWRDNIYPGCACDVPSYLYSFSFAINPNWSRAFSKQPEILAYIKDCVKQFELGDKIRFQTGIQAIEFNEGGAYWTLTTESGQQVTAQSVILALGPLNVPNIPKIEGQDTFTGAHFHSSQWKSGESLAGKKVAIIGTGASAIQIIPEIAKEVAQLYVFQRTAPWVGPRPDREIPPSLQRLYKRFPVLQWLTRQLIYRILEFQGKAFFGNISIRNGMKKRALRHIKASVPDPALRKLVTPTYEIGCKRILLSETYYPTLAQSHVELIPEAVSTLLDRSIIGSKGSEREVDTVIYATGFHAAAYEKAITIIGKNGTTLTEAWASRGPEAYLGTTVNGFPNLLFIIGPNTGLGHNSMLHIMESQFNYMLDYLQLLDKEEVDCLDVKASVQTAFNEDIQEKLSHMVWSSGCNSWYHTENGKNTTLWPGPTTTFRQRTRHINSEDYHLQ